MIIKEDVMKQIFSISIALVLFPIFIIGAEAFGAKSLYDDFSGTYIDSQKWKYREFVREVVGGKLVSKIGNDSGNGYFRNNTPFQNPESITDIECELTVVKTNLDTGSQPSSFVRIDGFFYNTQVSGGATGDIWAGVYIGDRGNGGLEAFWAVDEALDDNLTNWENKGSGTLIGPGTLNYITSYTAKIKYDGSNGFEFIVAGVSSGPVVGPFRQRAAVTLFKGLITGINANGGSGSGFVSAMFDNVYINNNVTVYDDFSTTPLDQTKWGILEFAREISSGKLRLNVQAEGSQQDAKITPRNQNTAYLEAKVLVESGSQVSPEALGRARIAGYYYNDSRGPGSGQNYNAYEGNVWISNHIDLDESDNLTANCFLWRMDTEDDNGPGTMLFSQGFTTPIAFDTTHALSIEFTGSAVIFKCNNETYQYDITTPTYPPHEGQFRYLLSRVYADPGESGYMKVNLDDVYTGYTAQAIYDATGTWDVTETSVEDSCDPNVYPETSTITITQTGNDFTLVDDDGETYTGTVNGIYYALYGETIEQGETDVNYFTFILSSETSGSGEYNWTWTDGIDWCEGGGLFTFIKDTTPPTVSSTTPANNATDVAINTDITATFSEAMDSSTITTDTFTVSGSDNIAGTVTYSGTTATFTKASDLNYDTTYIATITTDAMDLGGNALETDYTWSFTTQSETTGGDGGEDEGGGGGCFITTTAYGF